MTFTDFSMSGVAALGSLCSDEVSKFSQISLVLHRDQITRFEIIIETDLSIKNRSKETCVPSSDRTENEHKFPMTNLDMLYSLKKKKLI